MWCLSSTLAIADVNSLVLRLCLMNPFLLSMGLVIIGIVIVILYVDHRDHVCVATVDEHGRRSALSFT